jgi:hypothetical protein
MKHVVPDEIAFDGPYGLPTSLDRAQAVIPAAAAEAKKRNWTAVREARILRMRLSARQAPH